MICVARMHAAESCFVVSYHCDVIVVLLQNGSRRVIPHWRKPLFQTHTERHSVIQTTPGHLCCQVQVAFFEVRDLVEVTGEVWSFDYKEATIGARCTFLTSAATGEIKRHLPRPHWGASKIRGQAGTQMSGAQAPLLSLATTKEFVACQDTAKKLWVTLLFFWIPQLRKLTSFYHCSQISFCLVFVFLFLFFYVVIAFQMYHFLGLVVIRVAGEVEPRHLIVGRLVYTLDRF